LAVVATINILQHISVLNAKPFVTILTFTVLHNITSKTRHVYH